MLLKTVFRLGVVLLTPFASAQGPTQVSDPAKIGWSGKLSNLDGGLGGTVTVLDANTIEVASFRLIDASAPALYWWGSPNRDLRDGFRVSADQVTKEARGDTLNIKLDNGKSSADFLTFGLWCERFSVNFGQATLQPSNADRNSSTTGTSLPSNSTMQKSSKMELKPVIADQYLAARVYFVSVIGLVFLDSIPKLTQHLLLFTRRNRSFVKGPSTHSELRVLFHKLFTFPFTLPFLAIHTIPDILRLAVFFGLNVLFAWNRNQFSTDYNRYGWMTVANAGLALLMAARSNLFAIVTRIPSSTLLLYHRWTGRASVVHATIHFSLNAHMFISTGQILTVFHEGRIRIGLMAWISLCLIFVTSISFIRRGWFEAFYYTHALFLLFTIGAMIHATHGPEFLLPGIVLWVMDRIIRFANNFRRIEVTSVKQYPGNLTKLNFRGLHITNPGQIAWVQFPGVSFLNWHPFTVASASGEEEEAVIAIRGLGNYSHGVHSLVARSKVAEETGARQINLRVDGPYGVGRIIWGAYPVTVLVAGGIGITPGISIASSIVARAALLTHHTGDQVPWHIHMLWVVKEVQHLQWFEDELKKIAEATNHPSIPCTVDVTIYVTGGTDLTTRDPIGIGTGILQGKHHYNGPGLVNQGRPDVVAWFEDIKSKRHGLDAAVNACGPRSLIDSVRKAASKASWRKALFHVEEEVFEL